ncbi:MAG: lytic transglycosylase domain-containing protein [Nitrospinota bacterium]|nr:lytic transglycosylase domain-containing protein [Nitrospinota bacterium]
MKRFAVVSILVLLLLPKNASADIYTKVRKDGTIVFTDNPSGSGYRLLSSKKRSPHFGYAAYSRKYSNEEIDEKIESVAREKNLDPRLVRAVIRVESDFNPNAISNRGAIGLMQLMPDTARLMSVNNPFDAMQNIEGGTTYLETLHRRYNGNIDYILAAYNAGETAVSQHGGVPPYAETVRYIRKVKQYYKSGLEDTL